jgi:hypothetical protein
MAPFVRPDGRLFLFQWSKFLKHDDVLIDRKVKVTPAIQGQGVPETKIDKADKPDKKTKNMGKKK